MSRTGLRSRTSPSPTTSMSLTLSMSVSTQLDLYIEDVRADHLRLQPTPPVDMPRSNLPRAECPLSSDWSTRAFSPHHTLGCCANAITRSLMMNGRNNGKKIMAVRIVQHAFEIIHLVTEQNPIQILGMSCPFYRSDRMLISTQVDAIVNTGPREDSTRIGSQGTVRRQAVDVSPLRRVNQAIALLTIGVSPHFSRLWRMLS